jgi:hypothetical protein
VIGYLFGIPWSSRQYAASKDLSTSAAIDGATTQKTIFLIVTAETQFPFIGRLLCTMFADSKKTPNKENQGTLLSVLPLKVSQDSFIP